MKISTVRALRIALLLAALVFCGLGMLAKNTLVVMVIFCILAVLTFLGRAVISALWWRCPSCKCHLPYRGGEWCEFCPSCGEPLE